MIFDSFFQQLFEQAPGPILIVDEEGRVVDCNTACAVSLGEQRSEMLGRPLLRWVFRGDHGAARELFRRVFAGETADDWLRVQVEGLGVSRRSVRASLILGPEATGLSLVYLGEPERTRSRSGLSGVLQSVVENLPGQFILSLDRDGRIRYARGTERTHWRPAQELTGRAYGTLLDESPESRVSGAAFRKAVASGHHWSGLQWHVRRDGSRFPSRVHAVPGGPGTEEAAPATIVVGRDASEEVLAVETAERVRRYAATGELVGSIAHEVLQPFDRLSHAVLRLAGDPRLKDLDVTGALVEDVSRVNGMLDGLRVFATDWGTRRSDVDLAVLAREALEEERVALQAEGVEVSWNVATDDVPTLVLNEARLKHGLVAVLRNAREAVRGQEDARLSVTLECSDARIRLKVEDTGAGVPEEHLERAFEPFFTTKPGHLGLGLSVARAVVDRHGGRLSAERGRGGGTVVTLELPCSPGDEADPAAAAPLSILSGRRVLVVDDHPGLRRTLRLILERVGFAVDEAWSGRSALARLTSGARPDLVITDMKMREGTGQWLLSQLRGDFRELLRHTLIVTGATSTEDVEQLGRETGCPVLRKPFEVPQLLRALEELIRRE